MRVILPIAMAVLALFASAPSSGLDIDEVLPFLTDEYLNDLSSVFTGSLLATLEDELAAVNAEVASLEEGCRPKPKPKPTPKPAPLRITAGKDPLICQRCTEKKLRHQIKMCALMLMWGPPSCRRIEEKVRLYSDVEARTTEAAKLFRWYRCLCDGTGNGYNSFTDECSVGPTSEMIGRSLTHCGIDAANFRDLQGALLNDGRDITELLGQVNCEGVFNERDADKLSAKQPYCPALMAGQDFYQGCLFFAGDPTCECFNSGVEQPLAIIVEPEEPVTESPLPLNPADCPGLEDALCRQATAKTRVARKNPLIITNAQVQEVIDDIALTTWAVESGGITSIFSQELSSDPDVFESELDALIAAAVETQPTKATCRPVPEVDDSEKELALKIQQHFVSKLKPGRVNLALVIDSSGSIGADNYVIAIDVVTDMLTFIDYENSISPEGVRVSAITFSKAKTTSVEFNYFSDAEKELNNIGNVKNSMAAIEYKRGSTATDAGLELALRTLQAENGQANGIINVVAVITDGFSNNMRATCEKATEVKAAGISVFAFGITENVQDSELECIASKNDNIYKIASFASAAKIANFLRAVFYN